MDGLKRRGICRRSSVSCFVVATRCWMLYAPLMMLGQRLDSMDAPARTSIGSGSPEHRKSLEVPVVVTDPLGRIVTGLRPRDFQVFYEGREAEVLRFSVDQGPFSVGLITHIEGGSVADIDSFRLEVLRMLYPLTSKGDAFLIRMTQPLVASRPLTMNFEEMAARIVSEPLQPQNAWIEGLELALRQLENARSERRFLFVISNHTKNASWRRAQDVVDRAIRDNVTVFAGGDVGPSGDTPVGDFDGASLLGWIARQTGGTASWDDGNDFWSVPARLAAMVQFRYLLYCSIREDPGGGEYRRISVTVKTPRGLPTLKVSARPRVYVSLK